MPTPGALPGYLQLTDAAGNKTGSILYTAATVSTTTVTA